MTRERGLQDQQRLIDALTGLLAASEGAVQQYETHISWVLIAGAFAYKIKKAVRFDFLDFSTLEARRVDCHEELRLNRRLAPEIYLDVVAITGTEAIPFIDAPGNPIEYAVKMHAFSQQCLWRERVLADALPASNVDQLAMTLSRFHARADVAGPESQWGLSSVLQQVTSENLDALATLAGSATESSALKILRNWLEQQYTGFALVFLQRWAAGSVRECHGDLHLDNIVTVGERVLAFDCLEFSARLRWTDVISDIAFVSMDLAVHGQHALAARFVDRYLEATGDYSAVTLLRYYQIYCAMTRWKITSMQAHHQDARTDRAAATDSRAWASRYMAFAVNKVMPGRAAIVIMHGFSGSGKSTVAARLAELLDGIRIRSDVERKRAVMGALPAREWADLYDSAATRATYMRLATLAAQIAQTGMTVIVDATFLLGMQRQQFAALASALAVPLFIVHVEACLAVLQARLHTRLVARDGPSDADSGVLLRQCASHEPLTATERISTIDIDNGGELADEAIQKACARVRLALAVDSK